MRQRRLASLLVSLLLLGCALSARADDLYRPEGRWLDDRSHAYSLEELRGGYTVMTMAYGACRRVCATSLRVMEQAQALADARHLALNFVVVGLDPSEDHPKDWADYRTARHLTRDNWHFLSGDEASVAQLASRLGVHYWRYGEHTMHDFKIVLLAPDGRVLRSMDAYDQPTPMLLP